MLNAKRVCLLTGASGRLASCFVQRWAKQYHIIALYHQAAPSYASHAVELFDPLEFERPLEENESPALTLQCDLRDEKECERAILLGVSHFGPVDLLVNCAATGRWGSIVQNRDILASAMEQFHVNTIAPMRLSVLLLQTCWRADPELNKGRNRNVVNLSSSAALRLYPGKGQAVYAATKAALNMASVHMANEFAPFHVRVNALAPDSFPSRVSTEAVADAIRRLDEESDTGQIYELA